MRQPRKPLSRDGSSQRIHPPPTAEPNHRVGGWESLVPQASHLRPGCNGIEMGGWVGFFLGRDTSHQGALGLPGAARANCAPAATVHQHAGQTPLNPRHGCICCPLLEHMSPPKWIGRRRGNSRNIPTHPPPKAEPGGRVGGRDSVFSLAAHVPPGRVRASERRPSQAAWATRAPIQRREGPSPNQTCAPFRPLHIMGLRVVE